ncbi:glycoside hydrolase domain-containing protein [Tenggerimyces flavus]|uniref:Glycoside hydrolase domain-containing protein n=1 Tax=Tenggerimyces flavus TaxID=1708749 RepID=A0ABV7YF26_9ACTN|nr:glycoside hydrolase domain-containing protein [Tenggerimyces flavus]MBM7784286.1 putative alpha-1,2-mannosidase [Tenggerimyces flavus]
MRPSKLWSVIAGSVVAGLLVAAPATSAPPDYVSQVNPWVEADLGRFFFFQSATNPFGLVKLRPDARTDGAWSVGYGKSAKVVKGFSHLHEWTISGVQVMPTSGASVPKLEGDAGWESPVRHDASEVARPGYHRLVLDRYGITAELAATDRVGLHRYTYAKAGPSEILVNLGGPLGEAVMENATVTKVSSRELAGFVVQRGGKTQVHFNITFDRPFDSLRGWANGALVNGGAPVDKVSGPNSGVYVKYDNVKAGEQLQMKVALSFTGASGALRNRQLELPGWNFDAVEAASRARWNSLLGRIDVKGGTQQQRTKFYTDLFHVLCGRGMASDADGKYLDDTWDHNQVKQLPLDKRGKPEFAMYNYDALWLTQWNVNSILGLAYPEIYSGFVRSQLQMFRDGGLLPRGPAAGDDTLVMTGNPVASFITGAWNKGIRDYDIDLAYKAMLDAQSVGGLFDKAWFDYTNFGTGGIRQYLDKGYVPTGFNGQGTGQTLEYAHQDWALSQLAKQLGKVGINASQYATVVASSAQDAAHGAERAIDGRPLRAPTDVEWRSKGERNPWVELRWPQPRTLRQVVLSDRADPASNANGGTLTFSDGSPVAVSGIPADGSDKVVKFAPRKVSSVRFTVTGGSGANVGLNELEAWDDTNAYSYLLDRSRNWRTLYDESTGFIRPRNADGSWQTPFDPLSPRDFVEANSWQATWFTTHDVMGLANLLGGETAYADKLNYAFVSAEPVRFIGPYGQGFVSYGNQPGLEVAHLFNYVGYPWLSQYWVRQVREKTFGSIAPDDGYGHHDEDQGQMGALSALMAIGLFEVTGGGLSRPVYDITSPIFDEVTIKLNPSYYKGKQFRIVTHGNSASRPYIQRAKLDGRLLRDAWFRHDQLADGGTLELWLGPKPNKRWGVDRLPPSESRSAGKSPVLARSVVVEGPEQIATPYDVVDFNASFVPADTTLKEVFWSVRAPDGSPTDKATIDVRGVLTVNHRDGDVLVTATAADSGRVVWRKLVRIALDPALLRGNASRWPGVTASASSEYTSGYVAEKVFDGIVGQPDAGDWASKGEQNPWISLSWPSLVRTDRIVLYDRAGIDDVNGGTLTFSDGSSLEVSDIPPAGEAKTVTFPMKTFDSVRFQVKGGTGPNNGLSEFEVYAVPSVPQAPRSVTAEAGVGSATVSWQPPAFNGGAPVIAYVVTPYHDGSALDPVVVEADERSAVVPGLTAGEPYTFTVTARSLAGSGPESPPSNEIRPG